MARKGVFDGGRGVSRAASKRKQNGTVLFRSTFDGASYDGWRDHYSGQEAAGLPNPPLSLTRFPTFQGEYALKLSTPDRARTAIPATDKGISAYKNVSRFFTAAEAGLVSFSGYFTSVQHGSTAPSLLQWGIGIDTQLWNSSDRSFMKAECVYPTDGTQPQWNLTNNAGAQVAIPANASKGHTAGINQNKWNWNYVELTIDLNANGGRGAYHTLQINDALFDLTNTSIWADPTQSGQQATQGDNSTTGTAQHYLDFRGGLNFGVFCSPITGATQGGDLIAALLTATIYEAD